jgi:hypothetical protein
MLAHSFLRRPRHPLTPGPVCRWKSNVLNRFAHEPRTVSVPELSLVPDDRVLKSNYLSTCSSNPKVSPNERCIRIIIKKIHVLGDNIEGSFGHAIVMQFFLLGQYLNYSRWSWMECLLSIPNSNEYCPWD